MDPTWLDCRGKPDAEVARLIIERFNALDPGARFEAGVDHYSSGLKMWLLEAGARHEACRLDDGAWRVNITRGLTPAQGSISGVHHVVTDGSSVWTCERGALAARIDARTRRVIAAHRVARKASHLALDAVAGRLFVADSGANEVIALRAADLRFEQRWPAPGMPQLPLVSAEGIVCVTGSASGTLTIALPREGEYRVQTVAIGACPHDPLLSADGRDVFVPCAGSNEIVKVRLAEARIVGRCNVGEGPSHLALHPEGTRVYSANSWDGSVTCVSTEGDRVAEAVSGRWAHAIEITPDGRWVYVANFFDDTLAVFDAESLQRVALLATDAYPHGLDISPDGTYALASCFSSGHVRVFDAHAHRELARIAVGWGASHAAFACACAHVGCSVSDHVACVDLASLALTGQTSIH